MDASATIVLAVAGTILGGLSLAVIAGQIRQSAQLARVEAELLHLAKGVQEFYKWRHDELVRRAASRRRDTGKQGTGKQT